MKNVRLFVGLIAILAVGAVILGAVTATSSKNRTLVYVLSSDAVSLDPLEANDTTSWDIISQIYEGLMKFRPGSLEVEPNLASHYEVSKDGLVYTFYLQKNVQFQDGTQFDADVVLWNVQRAMEKLDTSYYADLVWGDVKYVEKLSQYSVRFTLKKPNTDFLTNLALPFGGSMVSPYADTLSKKPVGTGPYKLASWEKNKELLLQYNDNWWQSKLSGGAYFRYIKYLVVGDPDEALEMLLEGKAQIVNYIPTRMIPALREEKHVNVVETNLLLTAFLGFNTKSSTFTDVRVRKGLALLLDDNELIKLAYDGLAVPSSGPLPSVLKKEVGCRDISMNYEMGMRLLSEAGYSADNPLRFTLELPLEPRDYLPEGGVKLGQSLRTLYEKTGIVKITLVFKPFEQMLSDLEQGSAEAFVLGWSSDNGQVDNFLRPLFYSNSPLNFFKYDDPLIDKYLDEAQSELDLTRKMELYRLVCERLIENPPAVFLPHPFSYKVLDARVKGYNVNPINIEQLYFVHY